MRSLIQSGGTNQARESFSKLLTFIIYINLKEEAKEVVSVQVKN